MEFGEYGTGEGEFWYPWGIAIDKKGNFIMEFGEFGTGEDQFNLPYSVTIDKRGNI